MVGGKSMFQLRLDVVRPIWIKILTGTVGHGLLPTAKESIEKINGFFDKINHIWDMIRKISTKKEAKVIASVLIICALYNIKFINQVRLIRCGIP